MRDDESNKGPYKIFDYALPAITDDVEAWGKVYIQGMAALATAPFEAVVVEITKLKIKRPTQKMDDKSLHLFLEMTADMLIEAGYGYFAIQQGIKNLRQRDEGVFFPTDQVLKKYIHPVHWKLKREMSLLGQMLENVK